MISFPYYDLRGNISISDIKINQQTYKLKGMKVISVTNLGKIHYQK